MEERLKREGEKERAKRISLLNTRAPVTLEVNVEICEKALTMPAHKLASFTAGRLCSLATLHNGLINQKSMERVIGTTPKRCHNDVIIIFAGGSQMHR